MRGDFSAWNKDRAQNFRGTLHQQGRVLLDRDWNAQTEIIGEWQETAARDAFGAGVAAVPADAPLSFKVVQAKNVPAGGGKAAHVEIGLKKGRVWADGLLAELFPDAPPPAAADWPAADAVRNATYLGPPIQAVPLPGALPAIGDRDAVILETWLEELSPFQAPALLFEPALGGVDTTERVQTAYRFRLYRMAAGDTCDSIIDKLKDKFEDKGKLTVELKPTTETDGDCPVVMSGGFTGFEHRLYRIEIADTDKPSPQAYFKWSHFNGGLVGTGDFSIAKHNVIIHGNKNAILYSGSSNFYLEALDFDPASGCWKVVYGAKATLGSDGVISLPDPAVTPGDIFKGEIPGAPAQGKRFFRLWNGIDRVNTFAGPGAKKELPDNLGIILQFEGEAAGKYTPSDFWTFEVRAGEIGNPRVLIGDPPKVIANDPVAVAGYPPQGVFYHRVPLAEVNWTGNNVTGDDIEDCRRPFQPLTKLKTCCTYRVGDGVNSHGDFKVIQDAINALPKTGGEVCILPGLYEENIVLKAPHNKNIILKGCGRRTVIRAKENDKVIPEADPQYNATIYVKNGQNIRIESLSVEAHDEGVGIFLEGAEKDAENKNAEKYLKDIKLVDLFVTAVMRSAIKGHIAQFLTLSNSVVQIAESKQTRHPAVYLAGDDMLVERTEIRVLPDRAAARKSGDEFSNDPELFVPAQEAHGGLQIGGGSERVRILNNLIVSGTGNGITLGNIDLIKDGQITTSHDPFRPKGKNEDRCNPDDGHIDEEEEDEDGFKAVAGPPLYDILIKFNRIFNMGRNGIGVASFFSLGNEANISDVDVKALTGTGGLILVSKLVISENRIEHCVNMSPQEIPGKMSYLMGYGGIALAVVEGLVIRDNLIADNCRDVRDPICGIFALAAIGLDISQNEITEHLIQHYEDLNPANVKSGPRGGIWVFIALGQMDAFSDPKYQKLEPSGFFRKMSGSHAAKIHENIVSVPLGRSLTLTLLGDASILGNRFTTYGIVPVDIIGLFMGIFVKRNLDMGLFLQILSLVAGNVLIFDLGSFVVYREYKRLDKQSFRGGDQVARAEAEVKAAEEATAIAENDLSKAIAEADAAKAKAAATGSAADRQAAEKARLDVLDASNAFNDAREKARIARENLEAARNAGASGSDTSEHPLEKSEFSLKGSLGNGRVKAADIIRAINLFTKAGVIHFSDNQCKLNLRNTEVTIALSSIFILGLADLGFHSNLSSCNMPKGVLVTNAALVGGTQRATGNWLKESFLQVAYSAMTIGMLNITSDNESVHCLKVAGAQYLDRYNLVLGGILGGVVGDISEVNGQLKEICAGSKGLLRVLWYIWFAVIQSKKQTTNAKDVSEFITFGGGK